MDVISLPVEFDEKKIDGKFRVVSVAVDRVKELSLGAKPKVETKSKKVTTIAVEETIENSLEYLTGEEARAAIEEAKKFDYRRLLEEKKMESVSGELSELEKDLKLYLHEKEETGKGMLDELFNEKSDEGAEEESE